MPGRGTSAHGRSTRFLEAPRLHLHFRAKYRGFSIGGEPELIRVRMYANGDLQRVIDESLDLRIGGEEVQPENM